MRPLTYAVKESSEKRSDGHENDTADSELFYCRLWSGLVGRDRLPVSVAADDSGGRADFMRLLAYQILKAEGSGMQIVLYKSPKLLSGILRKIFKIQRIVYTD